MMRLRSTLMIVLSLAVVLGVLTVPTPATATATAATAATGTSWGTATAERQVLRKGCRGYAFRYRINVPGDAWMAELTLDSPGGHSLASLTYKSDLKPDAGTGHFRFCDVSTRPGLHTIRLKITSYDAYDQSARRSRPTTFRIVRR